jgi:hypothetical protein
MKPPPLLLGAALLFWGWQTGFLVAGTVMAVALESPLVIKARWEFSDEDFRRLWVFCSLLLLAAVVYAFTDNRGPADFLGLFENPNYFRQRNAGAASAKTAAATIRWLPMIFFPFVAAQAFSARAGIPIETMSVILSLRWKKARKLGRPLPRGPAVNVAYPYFAVCLFAASIHTGENSVFFWGLCVLLAWALWPMRSRRFGPATWAGALGTAIVLGYFGQRGVGQMQRLLENYNPQWFLRSGGGRGDPKQSKTAIGSIGHLKLSGRIVIRLEPEKGRAPPGLLREASYRTYKSQSWLAGSSKGDFEPVVADTTNGTSWVLVPGKSNRASVNLACYLPGGKALLPLPEGSGQLDNLAAYVLEKNSAGALNAVGPGLVIFDARYGPGASLDSPANQDEDTAVPPKELAALTQVISELKLKDPGREQALTALSRFFREKFSYSSWQGPWHPATTNETALAHFLLNTRSGHCEYFATAATLMLRQLNLPARYAVGYAVHETSGQKYVVRQRDAHAWCLVWNKDKQVWEDFDTTPASWVEAEGQRASAFQFFSDAWSRLGFEFAKLRWGQTRLRQYILWGLGPVLALLLYQILFRSRRQRQRGKAPAPAPAIHWPGRDSEFYEVERKLVQRGLARQPGEPLSGWIARAAADPALTSLQSVLPELLRLHYRIRFDPQGLSVPDRETLRHDASDCLARLEERTR